MDNLVLEKLGRWLCIEYYRDPSELQRQLSVHGIREVFGAVIRLDTAFGELLAGSYRQDSLVRVAERREGIKGLRLGAPVVRWGGIDSIDGVGVVRAKEVLMYIEVAERFQQWLSSQ